MVNKSATYYITIILSYLWIFANPLPSKAQADDIYLSQKVWSSIGGQDNWGNARYFMFTCQGASHHLNGHTSSYLWDRETGNCRFEGETSDNKELVVLFNLHNTRGEVFVDATPLQDAEEIELQVERTLSEFKQDAELLFLPTVLDGREANLSVASEKLVGSSRQFVAYIKNGETAYGSEVEGTLHIDAQSGRICLWQPQRGKHRGISYEVGGYRDIGGGLILPTRFTTQQGRPNVIYPVAAALVHIEPEKFTKL